MALNKKDTQRLKLDRLLVGFGLLATVALLMVGSLVWWGGNFVTNNVHNELISQKIYFPPQGSPALDPAEFPGLQQYAGQPVDTGIKAKAYANEFIAVHLTKVANGQTYSQVSAAAMADPTNAQLKGQAQTLFQGETLRGLLLGDAYAFWTMGQIAHYIAITLVTAGLIMAVLTWFGAIHIMMINKHRS